MRNKLVIILSLTLIIVGGFCLGIFFKSNSKISVSVYNPITNSTRTVEANGGNKFSDILSGDNIDGYDVEGYYYDRELKNKIKSEDLITNSTTVYVGYVQNTSSTQFDSDIVGVKYTGELSQTTLKKLVNYSYVDISSATGNLVFEENNNSLEKLVVGNADSISGINNYSKLQTVDLGEIQILTNCFNSCTELKNVGLLDCIEIENCFNDGGEILDLKLGKNVFQITSSFKRTFLKTISSQSSKYNVLNNIIYEKNGNNLKVIKAAETNGNITFNSDTTEIGEYAFFGEQKIKEVVAKEKLIKIGAHAFENSSITKLDLSENLPPLEIFESAFCGAKNLTQISLGTYIRKIYDKAFYGVSVEHIDLSSCSLLSEIGDYSFAANKALKKITFSAGNIVLGVGAFKDCENLTEIKNLMSNSISKQCFMNCKKLSTISNIQSVTMIDEFGFYGCESLANTNAFVDVVSVRKKAFAKCLQLTSAQLPRLVSFEEYSFEDCENLTEIKSNQNISDSSFLAFENCENLSLLNLVSTNYVIENGVVYSQDRSKLIYCLPNIDATTFNILSTVESVENRFLSAAKNLQQITTESSHFYVVDGVLYSSADNSLVCYPRAKEGSSFTVAESAKTILSNSFVKTNNLKTLNINSNIEKIENGSLVKMPVLETLNTCFLGESSEKIETGFLGWIFGSKTNLENDLIVPESLKYVKVTDQSTFIDRAFYGCRDLLEITVQNTTEVSEAMFFGCSKLIRVRLGQITKFNSYALSACTSLTRMYIKYSPDVTIKDNAFYNMASSIKVYVSGISSPTELANYKALFKKSNWDYISY